MSTSIDLAAASLDQLSSQMLALIGDDRPLIQIWGWNLPILSRTEIADMIRATAESLRALKPEEVGTSLEAILLQVPARVELLRAQSLAHIAGGNAPVVVAQIQQLLEWIERPLRQMAPNVAAVDWQAVAEKKIATEDSGSAPSSDGSSSR